MVLEGVRGGVVLEGVRGGVGLYYFTSLSYQMTGLT